MKRSDILNAINTNNKFIVEIGAGPIPFKSTNIIIDKYPFDNFERFADIKGVAPLIKADACHMPFADQSIDLLFMSQVIEHINDPIQFLNEAKRVAIEVYLEWPSPLREVIFGWSFHQWVIEKNGNVVTFYLNDLPQFCGGFFHNESDILFQYYFQNNFEKFNSFYYGKTSDLIFEMSKDTASEFLKNKYKIKVDFPSKQYDQSYSLCRILPLINILMHEVIPYSLRQNLKTILTNIVNFSNNDKIQNTQQYSALVLNNRLICLKCKKRIGNIYEQCACSFMPKEINGVLSLDADDYPNM